MYRPTYHCQTILTTHTLLPTEFYTNRNVVRHHYSRLLNQNKTMTKKEIYVYFELNIYTHILIITTNIL